MSDVRTCTLCDQEKPLTKKEFHYSNKGGWDSVCWKCRSLQQARDENSDLRETLKNLDPQALIDQATQQVIQRIHMAGLEAMERFEVGDGSPGLDLTEFLGGLTDVFAGARGAAAQIGKLFYSPETRQSDRIRIMELFARLVVKHSEQEGPKKAASMLSDEDIERELKVLTMHGKVHDASKGKKRQKPDARSA